ncbi:hypothetical protein GCM10011362_14770 [Marinobacter halophilus]|nr:hypothetical protein GCM10011362_14770 [Marinobacter halophilus]
MDGVAERTGMYSQRVLESPPPGTLAPHLTNVRKFRKFLPFHHPVTEDQAFLVRCYTKIVTKYPEKMLS